MIDQTTLAHLLIAEKMAEPPLIVTATLCSLKYKYFLTGSRFFNDYIIRSDWNFFSENNDDNRFALNSYNFVTNRREKEHDDGIRYILKHPSGVTVFLVYRSDIRNLAQRYIKKYIANKSMARTDLRDKLVAPHIWNRALLNVYSNLLPTLDYEEKCRQAARLEELHLDLPNQE